MVNVGILCLENHVHLVPAEQLVHKVSVQQKAIVGRALRLATRGTPVQTAAHAHHALLENTKK
jgi:hypothetical protein